MKYALHFALDRPSYKIDDKKLTSNSSVKNAEYFCKLSKKNGFESEIFPNELATSYQLFESLYKLSKKMEPGDLLFITYCGHGLSISAKSEPDGSSELLILYDRVFIDQEFKKCLTWFKKDVYIFIITNSCTNGTLFEVNNKIEFLKSSNLITNDYISIQQCGNYLNAIKYYLKDRKSLKNPIIHIASSSDSELSKDGKENTLSEFVLAIQDILKLNLNITYHDFFNELCNRLEKPRPYLEKNTKYKKMESFMNAKLLETPNYINSKL
jgi:hypothetical protein